MNIHIEFCIKWNYGPDFERVSKVINSINPDATIASNSSYPRSGAFEVAINQELVFSKLKENRFPSYEEIELWFKVWSFYII